MTVNLPATYSGSFEAYCKYASTFPILSQMEETELAERAQYLDDTESAKKLILHNIRFVVSITRSYTGYHLPLADLAQEGTIGLMKAIKRFDPQGGSRLVTFAIYWIKAEINEYIIKNVKISKVATTKAQRKLFFNLRKLRKSLNHLSKTEAEDIAAQLDVPVRDVLMMEERLFNFDLCIDSKVSNDNDDGITFAEMYADEDSRVDELLSDSQIYERKQEALSHALTSLCDRDKDIITNRWLKSDKATLISLGEKYQVSAERIRQLEKAAIKKMRLCFPLI